MLGIAVLGLVLFKLICLDLSQTQTFSRIISFIGSGLIMLVIGYFSPLPPNNKRLGEWFLVLSLNVIYCRTRLSYIESWADILGEINYDEAVHFDF